MAQVSITKRGVDKRPMTAFKTLQDTFVKFQVEIDGITVNPVGIPLLMDYVKIMAPSFRINLLNRLEIDKITV